MRRLSVGLAVCLVVAIVVALGPGAVLAQRGAQRNEPGLPTLAQVQVLNNTAADAVAVSLQSTAVSLPVTVSRQAWEYRQVLVPVNQDTAAVLNAVGLEGWEAFATAAGTGGTIWTLKRPK